MAESEGDLRTVAGVRSPVTQSAKFSKPSQVKVVPLERLYSKLESFRRLPVSWISGIPGAGKTSLVASYWDACDLSGIWLHVDIDDNDPVAFFSALRRSLRHVRYKQQPLPPIMRPEHGQDPNRFGRRFFRDLYARLGPEAVVVLDDYHSIDPKSPLNSIIAEGADEIPLGSRLIILSRSNPPAPFSRLIASSKLGHCTDDMLRLTMAETALVVEARDSGATALSSEIHSQTHGWVAGIVLLLYDATLRNKEGLPPAVDSSVFDYFAEQVFKRLEVRARKVLIRTAYLPYIDSGLAEAVSGDAKAGNILASAYRFGLFIDRHSERPAVYRYHPLFRLFLQEYGETEGGPEGRRQLIEDTANALLQRGQVNEAIPLLILAEQWSPVGQLLLQHAASIFREGRRSSLQSWISQLPDDVLCEYPWLLFWRGSCNGLTMSQGRQDLDRAMSLFELSDDRCGMAMTAAALIENHVLVWSDYNGLTPWIELLEKLMAEGLTFPSREAELFVRSALFSAVMMNQPNRTELARWAENLVAFLDNQVANDMKLSVGRSICLYCLASGNTDLLRETEAATAEAVADVSTSAKNRVWFLIRMAFSSQLHKPKDQLKAMFNHARAIAGDNALTSMEGAISLYAAWTADGYHDLKWFDDELERARSCIDPNKPLEAAFYYHLQAVVSSRQGDIQTATEQMLRSNASYAIAGAHIGVSVGLHALAFLWLQLGRTSQALRALTDANRKGVKGPRTTYLNAWILAAVDLKRGKPEAARSRLLSALPIAPRLGLEVFLRTMTHPVIVPVCLFALQQNIHPTLIKRVITMQQIQPSVHDCEAWPWRLRIRALGQFVIEIEQQPLTFERRIPRKQILLLKAIVAAGGSHVAADTLAEQLWPDADGDSAASIFEVTLSRLRQMCSRDCLVLQDGHLSLNKNLVSLDVWQFDEFVKECREVLRTTPSVSKLRSFCDRLFHLYVGHLLPAESDQPWLLTARERIKTEFWRTVLSLGDAWQTAYLWDEAIGFYERVLTIDLLSEEVHRRLIFSYLQCGRDAEALTVYKRLQKALQVLLSTEPSPDTRRLVSDML